MEKTIYDYSDYKAYLVGRIASLPHGGRGFRAQLAEKIGIQKAFVSHVLQGNSHFNLEHAEKVNAVFQHNSEESHFFLLLVQLARAGTQTLRQYFQKQMEAIVQKRLLLESRVRNDATTPRTQQTPIARVQMISVGVNCPLII